MAGATVTSAPKRVPSVWTCAQAVEFSDAAEQVLLDKQATYRLLTFFSVLVLWLGFNPTRLLGSASARSSVFWCSDDVSDNKELLPPSDCPTCALSSGIKLADLWGAALKGTGETEVCCESPMLGGKCCAEGLGVLIKRQSMMGTGCR